MARRSARDRIRQVVDKWYLVEPLFLSVWTMHHLEVNPRIESIRVGRGKVEYNPAFVDALGPHQLEAVLSFEAMRIVLKHPYARRKARSDLAYLASNVTLQEYLDTDLPVPRARDLFGSGEHDLRYFELYYAKLLEAPDATPAAAGVSGRTGHPTPEAGNQIAGGAPVSAGEGAGGAAPADSDAGESSPAEAYAQPGAGEENTGLWGADELLASAVDEKIQAASDHDAWGTVAGRHRELILAALRPRLDYRAVLRHFRASVLSVHRRLTRMKPNRRYGFAYMGSRYDFTTRLLVAVDVSGSMGSEELAQGFSVVNRFFQYGVPQVDVIQFDTEIKGPVQSLKRARRRIVALGRGGTSFDPVIDYLDEHPGYDGLIIFTDGYAPVPRPPRGRRTRILWLFTHEHTYLEMKDGLRRIGRAAFLRAG